MTFLGGPITFLRLPSVHPNISCLISERRPHGPVSIRDLPVYKTTHPSLLCHLPYKNPVRLYHDILRRPRLAL